MTLEERKNQFYQYKSWEDPGIENYASIIVVPSKYRIEMKTCSPEILLFSSFLFLFFLFILLGYDFPLVDHHQKFNVETNQQHVWPGIYKRSGMNGAMNEIGTLVVEEEEEEEEEKKDLYEKKGGCRAQEAREYFTMVARRNNEQEVCEIQSGSYKLYTNTNEK